MGGGGVNVNQCWPMWANSNTVMAHASLDKRIHIQPLQILISVISTPLILVPFSILVIILKKTSNRHLSVHVRIGIGLDDRVG